MKTRIILVLVLLTALSLSAQSFRGTILGTVTDPSGNLVTGATVKVLNTGTGMERTTTTGADGGYNIPELPVGTYTVAVTQSGFQTSVTSNVAVDVATERRVDVQLKVGQVTQTVQVAGGELPQIETSSTDLGGVLTSVEIQDMPLNGRDYKKMFFMTPGVAGSPNLGDSPGSYGEFSMNGARGRSNNFLLDGTDMNDGYRNTPAIGEGGVFAVPAAILPVGAVEEVNVLSNFQPEYGRNAGAVVNMVTKSGNNNLHGTVFEYFRNDALDARNYFNLASQQRAPFHNNQFGGSLGGPIVKNKTFFFLDYEGQRESVGTVTLACVPEGTGPGGSLSPNDASNPVIKQLLATHNPWPAPNIPNIHSDDLGCPNGPNASVITPSYNNLSSVIGKIDQNFNQNNILTGRYFFGDSTQSFPLALTASGGQLPGFNTITPTRVQLISLSYVHTIGANKVNEVRYGWNRFAEGFSPQDQNFYPSSIGLCAAGSTADCAGGGPHDSGLPIIYVSGTPTGGSFFSQPGATSADPRQRVDTNNQFIEDFSWKLSKHNLKFGVEFRRTSIEQDFDKYFRGRMKFNATPAMDPLQNFLAGNVTSGLQYSGNSRRHAFENGYSLYAQDSFHLAQRLTLNYGLRWDYYGVVAEKNNLFANFLVTTPVDPVTDTGAGSYIQVGSPGLSRLYDPDYKNFSPRASIAWDVTGKSKTVIRAGAGIFYDAFSQDIFLGHLPYSAYYAPGPAYGNFGPDPILSAGLSPNLGPNNTIIAGQPIFGNEAGPVCNYECDIFAVDPHIKTPYMENYNINIQQQITSKTTLQIGYVGSQGHRLFRFYDINQPNSEAVWRADCNSTQTGIAFQPCPTTGTIQDYSVPHPFAGSVSQYGTTYLYQEVSTGKSNYNSLQVSYKITGWHGITSAVNYVYSKSLDNSSDLEDYVPNAAQPQDSNNPQREYGPSNFNIPQSLHWVFAYQMPNRGGSLQRLKNGWGFDSSLSLLAGQPFTLNYNGEDDYSGGGEGDDRPDVVGPIVYHKNDPSNFLDLSSFAMPCVITAAAQAVPAGAASDCVPGTRHYGNLGRNSLVGPTYKQWDFAIYKNTSISERVKLQLRAEFFNILNHPIFANPVLPAYIADPASNLSQTCGCGFHSTTVGGANREVGNGQYLLTAADDVAEGNPFLGGGAPRGIQLAAKFTF